MHALLVSFTIALILPLPSKIYAQSMMDYTSFPSFLIGDHKGRAVESRAARHSDTMQPAETRLFHPVVPSVAAMRSAVTGEGVLYQPYFYPLVLEGRSKIKWLGFLQALFVDAQGNVWEDSDGDGRLIFTNDHIVKTRTDPITGELRIDRYLDANGDGIADSPLPFQTVGLRESRPIWEAGRQLALTEPAERKLLTWIDRDNDELVDSDEVIDFSADHATTLAPYLQAGGSPLTPAKLIEFIRGTQIPGLRDRQVTIAEAGAEGPRVWKLGDAVHSTPIVVGAPAERYDILYGDESYRDFYRQYRHRRQVVYLGANDGMLHAFNAGFYHPGDDPATPSVQEHGWVTRTPTDNHSGPLLGEELWGFIPYQLLPQLQWLARRDYTHVYYVDLKPKVTDVRIFTPDADHPNGWGTILIGGFRLGGSCGACTAETGAPPRVITADFNHDGDLADPDDTRYFFSAYFVLDITNPEQEPVLLWSFSDASLGLTTSYPAVVRVAQAGVANAHDAQARWILLMGTGPTGYTGDSAQSGTLFAMDLALGPWDPYGESSLVTAFPTQDPNSFLGDLVAVDVNLDYRVDVVYFGASIHRWKDPQSDWTGKLYRLTTGGGDTNLENWGVGVGDYREPSLLLARVASRSGTPADPARLDASVNGTGFPDQGAPPQQTGSTPGEGPTETLGPVLAAPTVALDEQNRVWLFVGTGHYRTGDRARPQEQHFYGIKDPVPIGSCIEITTTSCEVTNLVDASHGEHCPACLGASQPSSVGGTNGASGQRVPPVKTVAQQRDGWYFPLTVAQEGAMTRPTLIGGTLLFPTFVPADAHTESPEKNFLYAVHYITGRIENEAAVGFDRPGANPEAPRAIPLTGTGIVSRLMLYPGSLANTKRCPGGRILGLLQSSTGVLNQVCARPSLPIASRYLSWLDQREL